MPNSILYPEQFYGGWSLVDWRIEYSDGGVTRPFGEDAIGQILYAEDGHMSATVSRGDRQPIKQGNVRNASDGDKAHHFDSYFHYAGTWSISGKTVLHNVKLSMNPNMVGTQQIRKAEFKGPNKLSLSAYEFLKNGEQRHHILEWQRAT
ncbi:hypothetical protein GCM10011309_20450 [Litorimonas cladophorae]|uniref:Lipocalin-like domain-containing protein n=1 Tax=Litorimonas cladophorae TaxID=1220491 RepID=A0A918KNE4_9PROT|nr:lipocalin-like domain-containing protein [Litorimonas cladophorae]GGX70275.1 hypothetical protein GCM10011309_20450 [Litorimonas cladophorae]